MTTIGKNGHVYYRFSRPRSPGSTGYNDRTVLVIDAKTDDAALAASPLGTTVYQRKPAPRTRSASPRAARRLGSTGLFPVADPGPQLSA